MEIVCNIKLNEQTQTQRILDALGAKEVDGTVQFHGYSMDSNLFSVAVGDFIAECVEIAGFAIDDEINAICNSEENSPVETELETLIAALVELIKA